jgi:hypothetical protein
VIVAPPDAAWTFHPDAPEPEIVPSPEETETHRTDDGHQARPRAHRVALVGVVVSAIALATGVLGATHSGPFHASAPAAASPTHAASRPWDIRGSWTTNIFFDGGSHTETWQIRSENFATGAFSGSIVAPVGVETIRGSIAGANMTFSITFGTSTVTGTGTLTGRGNRLSMTGSFSNGVGSRGLVTATLS